MHLTYNRLTNRLTCCSTRRGRQSPETAQPGHQGRDFDRCLPARRRARTKPEFTERDRLRQRGAHPGWLQRLDLRRQMTRPRGIVADPVRDHPPRLESHAVKPESHIDLATHVVPELQRRGRYKRDYVPGTLGESSAVSAASGCR